MKKIVGPLTEGAMKTNIKHNLINETPLPPPAPRRKKTMTRAEALKQGYEMCYMPGYNVDYECQAIENLSDEEIEEWKPMICEKEPTEVNEKKEKVYYKNTDITLVP